MTRRSKSLLEKVAAQGIPIVYLSAGTERIRPNNEAFLEQMPPGIVLDHQDFGLRNMIPINGLQARDQAKYKAGTIAELKAAFPNARLFGFGDDKYGDAIAYTQRGVKAYIHDVEKHENYPGGDGVRTKTYDAAFIHRVLSDLQQAVRDSQSFS